MSQAEIEYELKRSRESLKEAKILHQNSLLHGSLSRAYYAVEHAARAALLSELGEIQTKTHKGLEVLFSQHLILNGKIEREYRDIFRRQVEDRGNADYSMAFEPDDQETLEAILQTEKFLHRMEKFIARA